MKREIITCDQCGITVIKEVCAYIEIKGLAVENYTPINECNLFKGHLCRRCIEEYANKVPDGVFSAEWLRRRKNDNS